MLKVALVVFGGFVAAVWIICGYLYFAPVDERTTASSPVAVSAGNATRQRDSPPTVLRVTGQASGVVPAPSAVQAPETAPAVVDSEQEKLRKMSGAGDNSATARDAALLEPPVRAQGTVPQYSASGGYVLDGDSVVIAPPTSADAPGSPAEQRRRTRLSVDISAIP